MIYLILPQLIQVFEHVLPGADVVDYSAFGRALAIPHATADGTRHGADVYPTLAEKVASQLVSLVRFPALATGNERLALAVTIAVLGLNGHRLTLSADDTVGLLRRVAGDDPPDVAAVAACLRRAIEPH